MARSRRMLALLVVSLAGCQRPAAPAVVETPDMVRLHAIADVYFESLRTTGKPPADEAAGRQLLKAHGDPNELLRSPEDGQPYVVYWGVDFRKATTASKRRSRSSHQYAREFGGDPRRRVQLAARR